MPILVKLRMGLHRANHSLISIEKFIIQFVNNNFWNNNNNNFFFFFFFLIHIMAGLLLRRSARVCHSELVMHARMRAYK